MFTRKAVMLFFTLGYLACSRCAAMVSIKSDPPTDLETMLKNFAGTRHHSTALKGKQDARKLIKDEFTKYGLHVWSEHATISGLPAENIVGMLRSTSTGKPGDQIVIVGAHYDTVDITPGVDDNGSGITALLQVAKQIATANIQVKNTIMFVAFDLEEYNTQCDTFRPLRPIACGSNAYVKNLTKYFQTNGGTIGGALILETILNHDSNPGSQKFPGGFGHLFPGVTGEINYHKDAGNFLAVVGRQGSDDKLISLITKHYEKDPSYYYRNQTIVLGFSGRPSLSPKQSAQYGQLYRSDHYEFWESDPSYSALMLTDTANFRGYMVNCYHDKCDDLAHVPPTGSEFLRRTINAVIDTVLELSGYIGP